MEDSATCDGWTLASPPLPALRPEELKALDQLLNSYSVFQLTYRNDPVAFVHDCISWPNDGGPAAYQERILSLLTKKQARVCVRSLHGSGKTAVAAWAVLWFALTRDSREEWKIPVTASAWRQLSKYLFPELALWIRRLRWGKIGRPPFGFRTEELALSLKLKTGEAFALASDNSALIEGAHSKNLLYVFDESREIPGATWDSAEGAFATGDAKWLAISTPGEPQGRFYEIHSRKPGTEDWTTIHVTLKEAVLAGRVSVAWAKQRAKQWGKSSAVFQNRVLGEFASSEADGVIPLAWVEAANQRWLAWRDDDESLMVATVGVDVGRGGDATVLALKAGNTVMELRRSGKDTMDTTGRVAALLAQGATSVVDVIGIGAGVVDRLRELGHDVVAFNASARTTHRDKSGELGFTNKRAASWWIMRELLEAGEVALPPDDRLTGDLTAPHWRVMSGGKIRVESKEDVRKRLGRSTDDGDAVIMAFAGKVLDEGSGGGTLGGARVRTR